jgi:integrase
VRGKEGPPKSKHGKRDVPLAHDVVLMLRAHRSRSDWPGPKDYVFATRAGTPLRRENIRKRQLKPAAEEAGVPWAGFHTFRHTCASRLFAAGRNAVQVQRWLGHHSPSFTLATYVHLLDDDLGDPLDLPSPSRNAGEGSDRGRVPLPETHRNDPRPAPGEMVA